MNRFMTQPLSRLASVATRGASTRTIYACVVLLALASASITTMTHKPALHNDCCISLLTVSSTCPPGAPLEDRDAAPSLDQCSGLAARAK